MKYNSEILDTTTSATDESRTGATSLTLRLMAAAGVGAIGLATVAGFTSMVSATTDNGDPIVTRIDPVLEPTEAPVDSGPKFDRAFVDKDLPFKDLESIYVDDDPNAIFYGEGGEFYCPPCGMG